MSNQHEGKTVYEWIETLQSGGVAERCAAALALAELQPKVSPAKEALLAAACDYETSVQMAAQVAIGFVFMHRENRRKIFEHLSGDDSDMQRQMLFVLEGLASSKFMGTTSAEEEQELPPVDLAPLSTPKPSASATENLDPPPPASASPTASASEPTIAPDIAKVTVLPWYFLLGAAALCVTIAWITRGVWWPKWAMVVFALSGGASLLWSRSRYRDGKWSAERFQSRARLGWSMMLSGVASALIGFLFPTGLVVIDNASEVSVRIFIDGDEWTTIGAGESKKRSIGSGSYRAVIKTIDGDQVLDDHEIDVSSYELHILNVLGRQVYFHGIIQYGVFRGGSDMKMSSAKWLVIPKVDYLFKNPPERIHAPHAVNKTYFTKGAPPVLQGDQ